MPARNEDWGLIADLRKAGYLWPGDRARKVSIEPEPDRLTIELSFMDTSREKVGEEVRRIREQAKRDGLI